MPLDVAYVVWNWNVTGLVSYTVCSEKDDFEEGEQEILVLGTVHAQPEPRRQYWTQDCGACQYSFSQFTIIHLPSSFVFRPLYTKSPNTYCVYSCTLRTNVSHNLIPRLSAFCSSVCVHHNTQRGPGNEAVLVITSSKPKLLIIKSLAIIVDECH